MGKGQLVQGKVGRQTFREQAVWLAFLVLLTDSAVASPPVSNALPSIEVFTTTDYPVAGIDAKYSGNNLQGLEITVYEIDGIQSVERALSLNLPADQERSQPIALQRILDLDDSARSSMHSAATGLVKVMEYNLDRYPAIVFDGEAVVYGVIDLETAFRFYQDWQAEASP